MATVGDFAVSHWFWKTLKNSAKISSALKCFQHFLTIWTKIYGKISHLSEFELYGNNYIINNIILILISSEQPQIIVVLAVVLFIKTAPVLVMLILVQSHPELRFCPGPNCNVIVRAMFPAAKRVVCNRCETSFWCVPSNLFWVGGCFVWWCPTSLALFTRVGVTCIADNCIHGKSCTAALWPPHLGQRCGIWHMAMCGLCQANVPPASRPSLPPTSIAITLTCIN